MQSRDYQQNRRVAQLINEARRKALDIREEVNPQKSVFVLPRSSVKVTSAASLNLYDPLTEATYESMLAATQAEVDLGELARRVQAAEINYPWLKSCILDVLETRECASVADVLEAHPANQGLASVVGLVSLALRYGVMVPEQSLAVHWVDRLGQSVKAHIPMLLFDARTKEKLSRQTKSALFLRENEKNS